MEIKRVQCPQCRTIFDVENKKGETQRLFACTKCKKWLRVRFSNPEENREEPVDAISVTPNKEGYTLYPETKGIVKGILSVNGKNYELQNGINTVGRKSPDSTATIQLEVSDIYMSRNHVIINCVNYGKPTFKAMISNDKNKNDTLINGIIIKKGEEYDLTNGCQIKMGNTLVVYNEVKK